MEFCRSNWFNPYSVNWVFLGVAHVVFTRKRVRFRLCSWTGLRRNMKTNVGVCLRLIGRLSCDLWWVNGMFGLTTLKSAVASVSFAAVQCFWVCTCWLTEAFQGGVCMFSLGLRGFLPRCFGFLLQPKDIQIRSRGYSKLPECDGRLSISMLILSDLPLHSVPWLSTPTPPRPCRISGIDNGWLDYFTLFVI